MCRWRRASRRTSPASPCRAWRPPARGHRRARARGRPPRGAGEARAPLLLLRRRRGPSDRAGAAARERGVGCGRACSGESEICGWRVGVVGGFLFYFSPRARGESEERPREARGVGWRGGVVVRISSIRSREHESTRRRQTGELGRERRPRDGTAPGPRWLCCSGGGARAATLRAVGNSTAVQWFRSHHTPAGSRSRPAGHLGFGNWIALDQVSEEFPGCNRR